MTAIQHWLANPFLVWPVFIGLSLASSWVTSMISGWRALADRYASGADQFRGQRRYLQSGAMRWRLHYNNILTIGADEGGLYLGVLFLFRAGHPPLYIPWREISVVERQGWFFSYVDFHFNALPDLKLTVTKKLGAAVAREGGRPIASELTLYREL